MLGRWLHVVISKILPLTARHILVLSPKVLRNKISRCSHRSHYTPPPPRDNEDRQYVQATWSLVSLLMISAEPKSKRVPVRLRNKIEKSSAAKQRKAKKLAKKAGTQL